MKKSFPNIRHTLLSRAAYLCVGNFASLKAQGKTIRAKQEAEHVPQGGSHHTMTLCSRHASGPWSEVRPGTWRWHHYCLPRVSGAMTSSRNSHSACSPWAKSHSERPLGNLITLTLMSCSAVFMVTLRKFLEPEADSDHFHFKIAMPALFSDELKPVLFPSGDPNMSQASVPTSKLICGSCLILGSNQGFLF